MTDPGGTRSTSGPDAEPTDDRSLTVAAARARDAVQTPAESTVGDDDAVGDDQEGTAPLS